MQYYVIYCILQAIWTSSSSFGYKKDQNVTLSIEKNNHWLILQFFLWVFLELKHCDVKCGCSGKTASLELIE